MDLIWQGILLGLGLTILVGPILVVYLQLGIEKGLKAGLTAALGVWVSDILFIIAMYYSLHYIQRLISIEGFENWLGFGGAIVLILMGIGLWLQKAQGVDIDSGIKQSYKSYFGYFAKGFLVNTLNPFPFFFWSGVMTSYFSNNHDTADISLLFGSIITTIVITDVLKVYLAKRLRPILTSRNILMLRYISGIVLFILGFFLGITSLLNF